MHLEGELCKFVNPSALAPNSRLFTFKSLECFTLHSLRILSTASPFHPVDSVPNSSLFSPCPLARILDPRNTDALSAAAVSVLIELLPAVVRVCSRKPAALILFSFTPVVFIYHRGHVWATWIFSPLVSPISLIFRLYWRWMGIDKNNMGKRVRLSFVCRFLLVDCG